MNLIDQYSPLKPSCASADFKFCFLQIAFPDVDSYISEVTWEHLQIWADIKERLMLR